MATCLGPAFFVPKDPKADTEVARRVNAATNFIVEFNAQRNGLRFLVAKISDLFYGPCRIACRVRV